MLTSKSNKVNTQKLESKPRVQTQMYDDSIGTTTYCMIICMKSRLTSFSYDSVIEGCISVKCQLMTVNFVGFGCQPGFRLHTSRQSFEPSYTRIQALLVFFLSFALASQPLRWRWSILLLFNLPSAEILLLRHQLDPIWPIFENDSDCLTNVCVI